MRRSRRIKKTLPFIPAHYIRTLDVISEVICVLMRRSRRIKKRSNLSQHAISELLKRFPSTEGTHWVFRIFFCEFFFEKHPKHILKVCAFKALGIAPTLAVHSLFVLTVKNNLNCFTFWYFSLIFHVSVFIQNHVSSLSGNIVVQYASVKRNTVYNRKMLHTDSEFIKKSIILQVWRSSYSSCTVSGKLHELGDPPFTKIQEPVIQYPERKNKTGTSQVGAISKAQKCSRKNYWKRFCFHSESCLRIWRVRMFLMARRSYRKKITTALLIIIWQCVIAGL